MSASVKQKKENLIKPMIMTQILSKTEYETKPRSQTANSTKNTKRKESIPPNFERAKTVDYIKNVKNKESIPTNFEEEKKILTQIYDKLIRKEDCIKNNCFESVKKCFTAISKEKILNPDLFEKIKKGNINEYDKQMLDCIMTGTSILCEISDENKNISRKICEDDTIMTILIELIENLHKHIKFLSLSEQIMENIMFVCLNIAKQNNKTRLNDIFHKIEQCMTETKVYTENNIIKFVFLLTIAYIWDDEYKINKNDIKTILNNRVEELEKYSENSWNGLSKNEIQKGIKCLSK